MNFGFKIDSSRVDAVPAAIAVRILAQPFVARLIAIEVRERRRTSPTSKQRYTAPGAANGATRPCRMHR